MCVNFWAAYAVVVVNALIALFAAEKLGPRTTWGELWRELTRERCNDEPAIPVAKLRKG